MVPAPTGPPRDVLVVASWFPAIDDSTKGRFVADQVEALQATGRVQPWVASFESIGVSGGPFGRRRQVRAIQDDVRPVLESDPGLFNPRGAAAPASIPVARVPIAGGGWGAGGTAHGSRHRDDALRLLAGRRERPAWSLIHAHTGYPDGAGSVGLARRLGLPLVITEHATFVARILADPWQRRAYVDGVRAASRVIAVSRSLGDELIDAIPEVEPKLVVIPNTVDVAAFLAPANVERRPAELLYVGYRTPVKAIDVLLTAFRSIRAARPDATLRLIGRSPDDETEAGWVRLAGQLGIADAVSFEPSALRGDVALAMARASLLVHPSRRETFGVAPVEALAAGLPVVASDIGPLREILGDDPGLGALAPVGDPAAFAAAVLATLDRRASFDPAHLRASVVERFGATAVAGRLADLYDEVAARVAMRGRLTSAPGRSAQPAIDRAEDPIVIAAFNTTSTAYLIRALPQAVLPRCRVLGAAGPGMAGLPAGLGAAIPVELVGPHGAIVATIQAAGPRGSRGARIRQLVRHPVAYLRRRAARNRWEAFREAAARGAVRDELARLRTSDATGTIEVVALDGLDHLALQGNLGPGIRLLPGGARWLGDRAVSCADVPPGASS